MENPFLWNNEAIMISFKKSTLLLFGLIVFQLNAQKFYQVDPKYPVHDLMPFLEFKLDLNNTLTTEQILKDTSLSFSTQDTSKWYFKIGATFWSKITVMTPNELTGWTLNFEDKLAGLPAWTRSNGKVDVYAYYKDDRVTHLSLYYLVINLLCCIL